MTEHTHIYRRPFNKSYDYNDDVEKVGCHVESPWRQGRKRDREQIQIENNLCKVFTVCQELR